jgi:peroxiredoxin
MSIMGWLFWKQEYQFLRPTAKPNHLQNVVHGDTVDLSYLKREGITKNTFIHFYNYDCPCSRFNIKEFEALVKKYSNEIEFVAVLQADDIDVDAIRAFKKKYDLGIRIIDDPKGEVANSLGVYSTPQAVILKENKLYYRGNYNKARFCMSKNTKFAEIALRALVNNELLPALPSIALVPYGCELPSNRDNKSTFLGL